jgi:hypothetical protein
MLPSFPSGLQKSSMSADTSQAPTSQDLTKTFPRKTFRMLPIEGGKALLLFLTRITKFKNKKKNDVLHPKTNNMICENCHQRQGILFCATRKDLIFSEVAIHCTMQAKYGSKFQKEDF